METQENQQSQAENKSVQDSQVDNSAQDKAAAGNQTDKKIDMPPDFQKKFDKIYKEKKKASERNRLLESHIIALQDQLEKMDRRLSTKERTDSLSDIKRQLKEARDIGDEDAVSRLEDQIAEIKIEEKLEKKLPKKPDVKQQQQEGIVLSTSEEKIITKWSQEEDEDGEPLRPWASSSNHPKAAAAAEYLSELMTDDEYSELSIKEKLALVDEKFGRKKKVVRDMNAVGEGSLTKVNEKKDNKLTPDQERIALRMFSSLPPEKAREKYLQGLKLVGGK